MKVTLCPATPNETIHTKLVCHYGIVTVVVTVIDLTMLRLNVKLCFFFLAKQYFFIPPHF